MMKSIVLACCCMALFISPANGQLVVDQDLGALGFGSTNLTGDTSTAASEVDYFNSVNSTLNWGNEITYQFELSAGTLVNLQSNAITGDPDFFVLDTLDTTTDGAGKEFIDAVGTYFLDGAPPDSGLPTLLTAGTYYVSAATYQGADGSTNSNEATFDFDLILEEVILPTAVDLGDQFVVGEAFSVDTLATTVDTELAIYDSQGFLLSTNDDFGGTLQSQIDVAGLDVGTYYIGVSEWNAVFADGFTSTSTGTSTSDYVLNLAGQTIDGTFSVGAVDYYSFNVAVPEPAAGILMLVGLAGTFSKRRRTL